MTIIHCAFASCPATAWDAQGTRGYLTPEKQGWQRDGSGWRCPVHASQPSLELEGGE